MTVALIPIALIPVALIPVALIAVALLACFLHDRRHDDASLLRCTVPRRRVCTTSRPIAREMIMQAHSSPTDSAAPGEAAA